MALSEYQSREGPGPWLPDQLGPVLPALRPAQPALCPALGTAGSPITSTPSFLLERACAPFLGAVTFPGACVLGIHPDGGLSRKRGGVRGLGSRLPLPTRWGLPCQHPGHTSRTAGQQGPCCLTWALVTTGCCPLWGPPSRRTQDRQRAASRRNRVCLEAPTRLGPE